MNVLESQNSFLGMESDRSMRGHQEFAEKIPDNAQVILLLEGDAEFNQWIAEAGKKQADPGQPLLYVRIKQLAPAHSRIEDLDLVVEETASNAGLARCGNPGGDGSWRNGQGLP